MSYDNRGREQDTLSFDDVTCVFVARSGKAIKVKIFDDEEWVPVSQISDDSEVWEEGDHGTLVVTRWIAEKKGWDDAQRFAKRQPKPADDIPF